MHGRRDESSRSMLKAYQWILDFKTKTPVQGSRTLTIYIQIQHGVLQAANYITRKSFQLTYMYTALCQARGFTVFLQAWSSCIAGEDKHEQLASTVPKWGLKPGCTSHNKSNS